MYILSVLNPNALAVRKWPISWIIINTFKIIYSLKEPIKSAISASK